MITKEWLKKQLVACTVFMLTITSIGGTYVTTVYADPSTGGQITATDKDQANNTIQDEKSKQQKAALGGLLFVGLVSLLHNKGSHDTGSASNSNDKALPSQPSANNSYIPPKSQPTSPNKGAMSAEEKQMIDLINNERGKQGLALLKENDQIGNVARAHSQDMSDNNFFDHTNLKGENPFTRLSHAGITYTAAGENIAINTSVPSAHQAFMNSAGHRANILSRDYSEVGVGIVHNGSRIYVTEDFIGR